VVTLTRPTGAPARLWRTAAVGRAQWVRAEGETLLDTVTEVYGRRDVPAADHGLGEGEAPARTGRGGLVPSMVEVEGLRSLARATIVVAWLAGRRLRGWVRTRTRRT
jgi:hypothetical protein